MTEPTELHELTEARAAIDRALDDPDTVASHSWGQVRRAWRTVQRHIPTPTDETESQMLPNQKKPNLTAEDVQVIPCPACTEPTLHIVRGEEKCCLQCAADGGSTMPGYVPLSKFNRWSE